MDPHISNAEAFLAASMNTAASASALISIAVSLERIADALTQSGEA